jgi:hypothetical protein
MRFGLSIPPQIKCDVAIDPVLEIPYPLAAPDRVEE